ncbi:6871_t:CDS:2 [Entrophospora sp. SA101]|nr:6871_t:CDS:2 [Entrophospora sp. SA101]
MNGTSKSSYGNCDTCDQPQTDNGWCSVCQTKIFQENFINWTSGNQKIDELIQETQINPINPGRILEWIPYEKIKIVKKIGKGGFSTIYEAIWIDGPIVWDGVKLNRKSNCKIALKNLDTSSESLSDEYLNELKLHLRCNSIFVLKCYGITKDNSTKNYMLVLLHAGAGDLRKDLILNSKMRSWMGKVALLESVIVGLATIHEANVVHRDFHSGNILRDQDSGQLSLKLPNTTGILKLNEN